MSIEIGTIASCISPVITALGIWIIEKKLERRQNKLDELQKKKDREQEKREEARRKNELMTLKSINAAIALSEATARAVQRIPDAHCNGDMHAALEYAARIKHEQKDFIQQQGIEALY